MIFLPSPTNTLLVRLCGNFLLRDQSYLLVKLLRIDISQRTFTHIFRICLELIPSIRRLSDRVVRSGSYVESTPKVSFSATHQPHHHHHYHHHQTTQVARTYCLAPSVKLFSSPRWYPRLKLLAPPYCSTRSVWTSDGKDLFKRKREGKNKRKMGKKAIHCFYAKRIVTHQDMKPFRHHWKGWGW